MEIPKVTRSGAAHHGITPPAYAFANNYNDCIEAAGTCCMQAREAARLGRLKAAQGLLQTAISLYRRAERAIPASLDETARRSFDDLVNELCYSAQVVEVEHVARLAIAPRPRVGEA